MLLDAFDDWFALMDETMAAEPAEGWPQVERVIRTAFRFFVERPDFVRLARWEALEGGPILVEELATVLRPLFERGRASSRSEMDAGRVRRCDARRLVITGYGAVLSYLSDAPLVGSLLGEDPTSPVALDDRAGAHPRPVPPRPGTRNARTRPRVGSRVALPIDR